MTHAERVIDKTSRVTKGELVAFYERVAPLMLPHLRHRPTAPLRAPAGTGGELFFQKHSRVAWPAIREAAELLRGFLAELHLTAFLTTSGGKGLHVVGVGAAGLG